MKNTKSKKLLAFFMAVVLAVTSFSVVGLTSLTASAAYNRNYAGTSYQSTVPSTKGGTDKPSDYLQAQFNFDGTLNGVDGNGAEIKMSKKNGEIILSGGLLGRKNVAEFSSVNTPGSYADASVNPFAGKDLSKGATVTFWHYQQHYKENANYKYIPVVTFYRDAYHYVSFTYGGYMLYADGAYLGNGIYRDYTISQDSDIVGIPSTDTTITASTNEKWCHYAFAVTDSSLSIYIGGVRYDYSTTDGGTTPADGTTNNYDADYSKILANVIDFIGSADTTMSIGYQPFDQVGYAFDADDIRLYNKALTQLQIRSIYGENDSSIYNYAEGHDPTIVENVNYGKSGYEGEYLYYMFGTAMTIYGSNDMSNWNEIGDSQGRTGYQNEEYWGTAEGVGAEYKSVLTGTTTTGTAAPLNWSAKSGDYSNSEIGTGAGKMVWAPSVYYNTNTGKYMMVSATSSWGTSVSCIFTAESDSIEGPYYNITPLIYSGFHDKGGATATAAGVKQKLDAVAGYSYSSDSGNPHRKYLYNSWGTYYYTKDSYPNCIDACPFYGADGKLYMSYGSCNGHIWMVRLTADGKSTDSQWMFDNGYDPYFGTIVVKNTAETGDSIKGSGEGSFCYYDSQTGKTYINVSFGFVHQKFYTMRTWANSNSCPMSGSFVDAQGVAGTTQNTDSAKSGMKLMGNYAITGSGIQYYDNGHCSYATVSSNGTNDAGKTFLAYHTRMSDSMLTERATASTNYLNEARVHQVLYNQEGWQCVLPYQYSGETFDQSTSLASSIPGYFSIIDHGDDIKNTFLSGNTYILLADSEGASTGTVSASDGSAAGTWSLTSDNYLTIVTDGSTYSGVMIKMKDEQGKERLVFSAVGTTSKNTIWGMQTGKFVDSVHFSNPAAQLKIDPKAFVHEAETGDAAGIANFYNGTTLEDGTYSKPEACEIHIAKGWTIDSIQNADDATAGAFELSKCVSSTDTYNAYYVIGTVPTDPGTTAGYDLALNVTYHRDDNPGIQYTEEVYTWVSASKVEAHAVVAVYREGSSVNKQPRSAAFGMKFVGSLGTATENGSQTGTNKSQWGIANYRSVNNFQSKAHWVSESSEVNNSSHNASYAFNFNSPKKAGIFATFQAKGTGTTTSAQAEAGDGVGKVVGTYYLDASLAGQSNRFPSGVSIDSSGNWQVTLDMAGVPAYGSDALNWNTQVVSALEVTGGNNPTWSARNDPSFTSQRTLANAESGTLAAALRIKDQGGLPSEIYHSVLSGKGTQEDIRLCASVRHPNNGTPYALATAVLYANVYVYDKSETRNALELATTQDITSNEFYTTETWERYKEAIRVANAYVNNEQNTTTADSITVVSGGSTYIITAQGVTKDGNGSFFVSQNTSSTAQGTFAEWISGRYDELFPSDLYDRFTEDLTEANSIKLTNGADYTEDSYNAFLEVYNQINQDYSQFSNSAIVGDGETSWRDINDYGIEGADAENYNPVDKNLTAKQNYQNAEFQLEVAMASLRKKADYTGLSSEVSSNENTTAQSNQLYTENTGNSSFDLDLSGNDGKDVQNYTIASWDAYDTAYNKAVNTLSAKTNSDEMFSDKSVVLTNPVDNKTKTIVADDTVIDESGNVTGNYSTLQQNIFDDTTALNTAVSNLAAPDSDDAYTNYDSSQILASYADKDAYTDKGNVISSNLETFKTQDTAQAYALGTQAVYVTYNGSLFKNTAYGQLDAVTETVLTGINDGKKTYLVTLNVYLDDSLNSTPIDKEQHTYGDIVTLTPPVPENAVVEKWVVTKTDNDGESKTTTVHNSDSSYSTRIQENTVVDAYFVTDGTVSDSNAKKVTVLDYFEKPIDVYYVPSGTEITVSGTTLTCGSNTTNALESPYYTFINWSFNNGEANLSSGTYTVTEDTVITQYGQRLDTPCTYTITGGTFAGGTTSATYAIDDKVSIALSDSTGFIGWAMRAKLGADNYSDYTIISYNPTYSFLAYAHETDIVAVTEDNVNTLFSSDTAEKVTEKLPLSFGYGMYHPTDSKKKFSLYCNFSDGAEATVVECGVIYTTDSAVATNNAMIKGASGTRTIVSPSQLESSQYMASKINANSGEHYMRSYVSYTYSRVINGIAVDVPRTEYGPIVKCINGTVE